MQFARFHVTLISTVNKLNQVCAQVDLILKHLSTGEYVGFTYQ